MSTPIPEIKETSKFNFITSIWIVPFIAIVIAIWLIYQYFSTIGPEIKIVFPKNEGLVAGQSVVKFKNVPIGKVTKIYLDEEVDGVVVVVRMNSKASIPYLSEYAKFWIVKPEVGFSGVSGLDTLISGTYINLYSKKGGEFKTNHMGLSQPYHDSSKGEYFHLSSKEGTNISVGMPVYYKNIQVGVVEYKYLALDNKSVEVIIFIDKPYVGYLKSDAKFWLKNSMTLDVTKGKIDVDIAPLNFLLRGGIVFSTSAKNSTKAPASDQIFTLYKNETEAKNRTLNRNKKSYEKFLLKTEYSIAGLSDGSAVRFDGFDIGRVVEIKLFYSKKRHKMLGEVLIELDTSVFKDYEVHSTGKANFYTAIEEGLEANIRATDPFTGAQFIALSFQESEKNVTLETIQDYTVIPVNSEKEMSIMQRVSETLEMLNKLPLSELLASFTQVVDSTKEPISNANKVLLSLNQVVDEVEKMTKQPAFKVMPKRVNKTLATLTQTLKRTEEVVKGYDSNALMMRQLSDTLRTVTQTSKEMQLFLKMLNRKPNSLIFGDK